MNQQRVRRNRAGLLAMLLPPVIIARVPWPVGRAVTTNHAA
jgi:hypothetical protein